MVERERANEDGSWRLERARGCFAAVEGSSESEALGEPEAEDWFEEADECVAGESGGGIGLGLSSSEARSTGSNSSPEAEDEPLEYVCCLRTLFAARVVRPFMPSSSFLFWAVVGAMVVG